MKCINCKNLGKLLDEDGVPYDWCDKVRDNPDIHAERECKHYITATHADRIRAMSDEDLAELFESWIQDCGCNNVPCHKSCKENHEKWLCDLQSVRLCKDSWLDWLREETDE